MDRDPRENDGRMVPDRGESGEPEGKADGEKSTENAKSVVDGVAAETNRIAKAAPALAPEETPMMSGDASGFRKTVW